FPFMIFLLALLSFLRVPDFFDWVIDQAEDALTAPAFAVVNDVIGSIEERGHGELLSIGAVIAFWGASAGVRSLMSALNSAYVMRETRAFWKKYLLSFGYTIGLAGLIIIAAASLLLGPESLEWISGFVGLNHAFVTL